jgi:regulator of sigma E protease
MDLTYLGNILLLVFGFGFVIFWHELGHFLAAKWAGVKVEQFAVGFGQALLCWRKGIGLTVGTSAPKYEQIARARLRELQISGQRPDITAQADERYRIDLAARDAGLGETEYRLNWMPLGGYVKMLGQDDMRPNAEVDDPRAFNHKSIGQRMVIVSAGVVMNVILAAILFTALFLHGFNAPPASVGAIAPGSPSQAAGMRVGDRILTIDGRPQHDFTKVAMNTALMKPGEVVSIEVEGSDGQKRDLLVTPRRPSDRATAFVELGIRPPYELRGIRPTKANLAQFSADEGIVNPDVFAVPPDHEIVAINGTPVGTGDVHILDDILQKSDGRPVELTIRAPDGAEVRRKITPVFAMMFGDEPLAFAGMVPRARVASILPESSGKGRLRPGDVIVSATVQGNSDTIFHPDPAKLRRWLTDAGDADRKILLTILRDGKETEIGDLTPNIAVGEGRRGLGIGLDTEDALAVVGAILPGSPADRAGIPAGARITEIAGEPVTSWHDVRRVLREQAPEISIPVSLKVDRSGTERMVTLKLSEPELAAVSSLRYTHNLVLREALAPRRTSNPLVAAWWGVQETRDLIVQFYITLKRMAQQSVSYKNLMGPVGIFQFGTRAADRGTDWLIWFLAQISANLAVVNFLPIPIVDGGLFVFLLIEKIKGKPVSPRTQAIAQVVGLALILSIFVLVTYQDILRIAG